MGVFDPAEVHRYMGECYRRSDLEGVLTVYEPSVAFAVDRHRIEHGLDAARTAWAGFMALDVGWGETVAVLSGDVALVMTPLTVTMDGADGEQVIHHTTGTDVMRLQADGTWKIVIDDPWGDDLAPLDASDGG